MTPAEFKKQLRTDLTQLRRDAGKAITRTAYKAVSVIASNAPVAFGELRESIHGTSRATIVSAPHASAVEEGSRPHYVPLEELIEWVKLRGAQGLTKMGMIRSGSNHWTGSTTREQATRVAQELRAMRHPEGYNDIDAPEKIARRIQQAILKTGTKPLRFVMKSLPDIMNILHNELGGVFK